MSNNLQKKIKYIEVIPENLCQKSSTFRDQFNCHLSIPGLNIHRSVDKECYVDDESFLLYPGIQNKNKREYIIKQPNGCNCDSNTTIDTDRYTGYGIKISDNPYKEQNCYNPNCYKGAGRGFGNNEISTIVHYSENTRNTGDNLRTIVNDRMYVTNRNYQNSDHTVLPFPQCGIDTRNMNKFIRNY